MSKYNTDKPVDQENEDRFQRYGFAKRIADSIKENKDENSVVFGINGAWGEGKTSILNFIENELKSASHEIICLRFNPWMFGDESTLLISLFNSLAQKLEELEPKVEKKNSSIYSRFFNDKEDTLKTDSETIGDLFQKYGEMASVFGFGGVVKTIGEGLSSLKIEERKKRIENVLVKNKKRIVVFIDDIDRLDKNEIYSILKIVKLTGDFKYITYILSFDTEMVASAISTRFGGDDSRSGHNFLEKIIQIPLTIPKASISTLQNFCIEIINSAITDSGINFTENDAQRFMGQFTSNVINRLTTPRLAIRYGNLIRFSLPILKGEVNYVDLLLIESLKIFYPDIYDFIKSNPKYFINDYKSGLGHGVDGAFVEKVKSKINNLSNSINEDDKERVRDLLQNIFPQLDKVYLNIYHSGDVYKDWYSQKRICSPNYFDRYFEYSLPEGAISDVSFESVMNRINEITIKELSNSFRSLITSGNVNEFFVKIRNREKQYSWQEGEKISKAIVQLGDLFPNEYSGSLFNFNSPLSHAAIFIYNLIGNGDSDEAKIQLSKDLMEGASSFEFAYEINRWLSGGEDEKQMFSKEEYQELANILIDRAKKEAGGDPIFEKFEGYIIYIFGAWSEINREQLHNYIKEVIDEDNSKVVPLLRAIAPTVSSNLHPDPYKTDFSKDQYDWMKSVLDIDYVYNVLEKIEGKEIDITDVKFTDRMEPNVSLENLVKQFIYWYRKEKDMQQD